MLMALTKRSLIKRIKQLRELVLRKDKLIEELKRKIARLEGFEDEHSTLASKNWWDGGGNGA